MGRFPKLDGCKGLIGLDLEEEASGDKDLAITGARIGFLAEMVF